MARFFAGAAYERGPSSMLQLQSSLRIVAYAILLGTFAVRFFSGLFDYNPSAVITLATVGLLVSLGVYLSLPYQDKATRRVMFTLPFLDVVLITCMIHYSGGVHSSLIFLYLLPAISSVLFSVRFAWATGGTIILSLTVLLCLQYFEILPVVAKTGYTGGQLAFVHIFRLTVMQVIVIGSGLLLISYLIHGHRAISSRRESTAYFIAHKLHWPLLKTQIFLDRVKESSSESTHIDFLKEAMDLRREVDESLKIVERELSTLNHISAPIMQNLRLFRNVDCSTCTKRVSFLQRYWGIPEWYRRMYDLGEFKNDLHCSGCHSHSARTHGECEHCVPWAQGQINEGMQQKISG